LSYNLKNFNEKKGENIFMSQPQFTREQLEKRLNEVREQLDKISKDERIELDSDMEEQAIQVEQEEVGYAMEENLRRELIAIEDVLARMDENK
jgi:RNA polymerase-binding transcription factor DksA